MVQKVKISIFLVLLVLNFFCNAQRSDVVSFKGRTDFPATSIHDVVQDSTGYIWIASSQGVYRFDGTRFKGFGGSSGIDNCDARCLFVASDSSLWVVASNAETWRIKNEVVYKQKSTKESVFSGVPLRRSFIETNDSVLFYTLNGDLYCFHNDSLIRHQKSENSIVIASLLNQTGKPLFRRLSFFLQLNADSILHRKELRHGNISMCSSETQADLYMGNLHVCVTDTVLNYQFLSEEVLAIEPFDSMVLKSVYGKGTVLCNEKMNIFDTLMHDAIVTSILVDKNNGIWLGTLKNGLFYIRNAYARSLLKSESLNNGGFSDIIKVDNAIWAISGDKLLQINYRNKREQVLLQFPFKPSQIQYSNNLLIVYNLRQLVVYRRRRNQWLKEWEWFNNQTVNCHLAMMDDKVYIAGSRGLFVKQPGYPIKTIDADARIRFLARFVDEIYAVTDSAILIIDKRGRQELNSLSEKISYLGVTNRYLFMVSPSTGLTIFNDKGNEKLILENYKQVNHIMACDSLFYISTPKGVFVERIHFRDNQSPVVYNKLSGIRGDNIHKVLYLRGFLYVMHEMGITITPIKTRRSYNHDLVVTSCHPVEKTKEGYRVVLGNDKTHVQLFFSDFNYASLRPSVLYFTVDDDSSKNVILNNQLDLINLKSGFTRIFVEPESGEASKTSGLLVDIYKEPSLNEEIWLQLVGVVLFFSFLTFIIYNIIKHVKNRERIESAKVAQMQIVLQQQMNPHFIFNSLTSINHYILQNKPMESSRYLTKFSTLIRSILDNSGESYIPLGSEAEGLEDYLQLELLRFKGRFSYKIEIEPNLNKSDFCVPPFMIHPFVERALREGVINRDEKGLIIVRFIRKGQNLVCSIFDNGVGLSKSNNSTKKNNRTSKNGTQIAKQRIDLYNATHMKKITLEMNDTVDHAGNITGTSVFLTFPIKRC